MESVVVTGVGAVTPLGVGARTLHERWSAGVCGIRDGEGACADFDPADFLSVKEARRADRFTQLAIAACTEALADASWEHELPYDPRRVGCVLGTGIGGISTLVDGQDTLRERGPERVSPLAVPLMMSNAGAAAISLRHGLRGPSFAVSTACASGAHALGCALRMLQNGEADAVVAGGSEAGLAPLARAAFSALDALSKSGISRPFDARRDGFVMGEGAAVLVLERSGPASVRGARVLGTIRGYGASSDAYHLTAPREDGAGQADAMLAALADAGVAAEEIDYVNAHGTATPLNDRTETRAIKLALGEHAEKGAGLLDEVRHRSSARRRGRGRGGGDAARPALPHRPADARLLRARGRLGSRLRARRSPAAVGRRGQLGARSVQLVWLRRPQRGVVPGVSVTVALVERLEERLTPSERLEVLTDPGSLQLLRTDVRSRRMGERARSGDGVLAGHARVDGRQIYCYAQDSSFAGGSLGEAHAETVVEVLRLAGRARVPVIGFVDSAGARMQEGLAALSGYGRIFAEHVRLSGTVPQISIVCGPSAGGSSYGPALTDFVIMSARGAMFLTGPSVVSEVTGERVDTASLGGPRVHERNGVCHFTAPTDVDAALLARDLLGYLPQHAGEPPQMWPTVAPPDLLPDGAVPSQARKVYDVRHVVTALVDGGRLLELSPRRSRNVVCALARLEGRAIGIVANQPKYLGGVLDAEAAQKAARFVRSCNAFGLPLVVFVDTPGFLPGSRQERDGVIRHGAKLVHAFAEATVPSVTVILRKAFGGAFIAMNSKALGADYVFAWPDAELGVMGAEQAVGILNRREITAADDPPAARRRLASSYAAEHLRVGAASADGSIDAVIAPDATRERIASCLGALAHVCRPESRATNIQL